MIQREEPTAKSKPRVKNSLFTGEELGLMKGLVTCA